VNSTVHPSAVADIDPQICGLPTKNWFSSHLPTQIVNGFNNFIHCSLLTEAGGKRGLALLSQKSQV
jgi:hypothetical protein